MLDSVWKRWAAAAAAAVLLAVGFTALMSSRSDDGEKTTIDAAAVWKRHTGIDLATVPRPAYADSSEALDLDGLVAPLGLRLSTQRRGDGEEGVSHEDAEKVREALREAALSRTTEGAPLNAEVAALVDRHAATLDEVAAYVEGHDGIRWREDPGPRSDSTLLRISDHLILHRMLMARAFVAFQRGERDTALQMFAASRKLTAVLDARSELMARFMAVAIERNHLSFLRRAGRALGLEAPQQDPALRERFLSTMSAEAATVLTNASRVVIDTDRDPEEGIVRVLAGGSFERTASEAVAAAAENTAAIRKAADGCAELKRKHRQAEGMFAGTFFALDAKEAWRRFIMLELDRAITRGVMTGRTNSPCPSVTITVTDGGTTRTVTTKDAPEGSYLVLEVPDEVRGPVTQ